MALDAAGTEVVFADTADRVGSHGGLWPGTSYIRVDVAAPVAFRAVSLVTVAGKGGIDILDNGAVIDHGQPLQEITPEEWDGSRPPTRRRIPGDPSGDPIDAGAR